MTPSALLILVFLSTLYVSLLRETIKLSTGEPLKYDKIYTCTTKGFIASGGDGYDVFPECERYDSDYDIVLSSLGK